MRGDPVSPSLFFGLGGLGDIVIDTLVSITIVVCYRKKMGDDLRYADWDGASHWRDVIVFMKWISALFLCFSLFFTSLLVWPFSVTT